MKKLLGILLLVLVLIPTHSLSRYSTSKLEKIQDKKFEWYNEQVDKLNKFFDVFYNEHDCDNSMGAGLLVDFENCLYRHLKMSFMEIVGNYHKQLLRINHKYYLQRLKRAERESRLHIARIKTDRKVYTNFIVRNFKYWEKELEIAFEDIYLAEQAKLNEALESEKGIDVGETSGTAFFINNEGYLLTNNHVVEGCKLQKINYFNKEHDTEIIATDKILDLALLKVKLKPKSYLSFSKNEPKKLQIIYIAGYPLGKYLSDDLKIDDGKINALKGFEDNSNEIQVSVPINPGNSGGPIVNEKGQLVAIAVSGMSKEVTESLNFGIKSSAAANFLKLNKISPGISYMNFSMNNDKLVKLLEESTVYTFCN